MTEVIMTLEQIQEGLKDKRLYIVAEETGISYPTLKTLAEGIDRNYTINILKKVSAYLTK